MMVCVIIRFDNGWENSVKCYESNMCHENCQIKQHWFDDENGRWLNLVVCRGKLGRVDFWLQCIQEFT